MTRTVREPSRKTDQDIKRTNVDTEIDDLVRGVSTADREFVLQKEILKELKLIRERL